MSTKIEIFKEDLIDLTNGLVIFNKIISGFI